ncbi:hypothetical protein ACH4UX_15250 [Streptomyces althioticus]|uniref:hypothetical protein n=1 Tax=Streptomyces althioticus TaxID=83380 RepID=UPI001874958C
MPAPFSSRPPRSAGGPLCHADDVARKAAARLQAVALPEPQDGPEPDRVRGWFRWRT